MEKENNIISITELEDVLHRLDEAHGIICTVAESMRDSDGDKMTAMLGAVRILDGAADAISKYTP